MSKGFIDDILDNLISKSAKEVENKIFDEIENNFNDDIVFSENHKDKINNILYRNKTKIGFRTLTAVAILSVITLSAIICTNATRIQVINKPLLSTLMAETGYTLKNKDNSRSILYTKDNKNLYISANHNEICFNSFVIFDNLLTEINNDLYISKNDYSKMLDIIDKLSKPVENTMSDAPELINEGRNFISKEDSITKALEVVNNYYGIEIDKNKFNISCDYYDYYTSKECEVMFIAQDNTTIFTVDMDALKENNYQIKHIDRDVATIKKSQKTAEHIDIDKYSDYKNVTVEALKKLGISSPIYMFSYIPDYHSQGSSPTLVATVYKDNKDRYYITEIDPVSLKTISTNIQNNLDDTCDYIIPFIQKW